MPARRLVLLSLLALLVQPRLLAAQEPVYPWCGQRPAGRRRCRRRRHAHQRGGCHSYGRDPDRWGIHVRQRPARTVHPAGELTGLCVLESGCPRGRGERRFDGDAGRRGTQRNGRGGRHERLTPRRFRLQRPPVSASRPLETPASLAILTGETIRQRGDVTVEEAETRMVGITSQAAPGNGGGSRMSRGFGGLNSVMKLYDGAQLFVASGTLTFPFDTWSVERIEFLGGPASVMYGNGAIGGVVNVIPRRPNRYTTENAARVAFGSNNTVRAAFGRGGPLNDRVAYRFDISHNRSDGWIDRGESHGTAVSGSVSFGGNTNARHHDFRGLWLSGADWRTSAARWSTGNSTSHSERSTTTSPTMTCTSRIAGRSSRPTGGPCATWSSATTSTS